jgi:dienelactone hydrolase
MRSSPSTTDSLVQVPTGTTLLEDNLTIPASAQGIVLFAHGSGSSRHSPRNRFVAQTLNASGIATLLLDLLTAEEETAERETAHLRFDIGLLAARLIGTTDWLTHTSSVQDLPLGYFGASTGAGAALVAAAARPDKVRAVVARGGRPDLASSALRAVQAPTLLLVGSQDTEVIHLNRTALNQLHVESKELVLIPGASHLFAEPGTLAEVARLATAWFLRYLPCEPSRPPRPKGQHHETPETHIGPGTAVHARITPTD